MHDLNFDSLKNIKTPQAWLDKAAAIPETAEKKRVFPLYRLAAVASIVLVSAVGLAIFLLFGNGAVPVAVRDGSTEAASPTWIAETVTGSSDVSPTLSADTVSPTDERIAPTEEHAQAATEPVKSTTAPPATVSRSAKATDQPAQVVPSPTSRADSVITPDPTRSPVISTDPPATQEPSDYNYPAELPYIAASATFPATMLHDGDVVCCAIYDHGKLVSQGEASIYVMKNGNVFACYDTSVQAERDKIYHYSFFRKDAGAAGWETSPIFARGTLSY